MIFYATLTLNWVLLVSEFIKEFSDNLNIAFVSCQFEIPRLFWWVYFLAESEWIRKVFDHYHLPRGRFGHKPALWPLPGASPSNDDAGQLVMRIMMTTTTKMTMTIVIVMTITITKIARDYVEVPLLWSLPRACSVLSRGQARTESSSSSSRSGILLPYSLTSLRTLEGSKLFQKGNRWLWSPETQENATNN